MKVKENPSTAVPLTQSDIMDKKLYTNFSEPQDGVDPHTNALEEGLQPQDSSNNLTIGTQCGADSSIASTIGDFDVGVMPVIYDECERNRETSSRSITLAGDSSGDETFAAEMMSPSATTFSSHDMASHLQWSNRPERNRHVKRRSRPSHEVGAVSDIRNFDQQNSDQRRCNRFLSTETIVSDCHSEENAQAEQYQPINYSRANTRHASGEYSSNGSAIKEITFTSNPFGNSYEPASASGSSVMREIDLAVSLAHSRFKNVSPQSCDVLSNRSDISPAFSGCDVHVTRKDNRSSSDAVIVLRASQHADATSMTKNYASHNINARSAEDEWKRKSDYGSSCPAVHELKATFEQSDVRESLGRRSIESSERNVQSRERNRSAADVVRTESANSEQNGLVFETKITPDHDERNTASYAVGASLLHVQSSPHEVLWPRSRSSYEKQAVVRSNVKNGSRGIHQMDILSSSESDNKPINLSIQQGKTRQGELGCDISSQKLAKTSDFRKNAKSFSSRDKPYQNSKKRTRSQCSVSPGTSGPPHSFEHEFVDSRSPTATRQGHPRDLGIDNRLLIENYNKDSASCISQGLTSDSNAGIFSPSEASHMMVQDEAKTYAILSGRPNEEMMNSHMLSTSGSTIQQQSLFPQARHSHSIINYVGHHVPSPDIRPSEMSPSPPVRDHRATPSSSLPGIASSSKGFQNVIVPNRHNLHSVSPSSREDFHAAEAFQRQYDGVHFDSPLQDSRHHLHQHHSLAMTQHQNQSTFSPLHIPQSQQTSQFLMKHHQTLPPHHSALGSSSAMLTYPGPMRIPPHQGYLKPPPVDLDDLSEDERERMRVKRERNRVAAAKCRNRRRELLERLEKEAEQLEREQELLRENVRRLRVQKLQLGNMLEEHETSCQKKVEDTGSSPNAPDGSPTNFAAITAGNEQSTSTRADNLEGGDASTAQSTTSPVQLSSQA